MIIWANTISEHDYIMKLVDSNICTGCGACKQICPRKAIFFIEDDEGFPSPQIQEDKCIDCGRCNTVCPAISKPEMNSLLGAYAAQLLDQDALQKSSSGGLFTALAREIFKRQGIVYGCVWDENYNAVIRPAENEKELMPMRGSKYVWSWAGDTFGEVKSFLENGKTVMFTGLPCQVAGLKKYLGRAYENLYLVTFFCGGAPSPLAFREYLKTITKKVPIDKVKLLFRDKEKKGVSVTISYQGVHKRVYESAVKNSYFYAYSAKVFHRLSCFQCPYRYGNRIEDITIGDFWKIEKFHPDMNIRSGVSALLINTEKGYGLLEDIKDSIILVPTTISNIAYWNNLTLNETPFAYTPVPYRTQIFKLIKEKGWKAGEGKYLYTKERFKQLISSYTIGKRILRIRSFVYKRLREK